MNKTLYSYKPILFLILFNFYNSTSIEGYSQDIGYNKVSVNLFSGLHDGELISFTESNEIEKKMVFQTTYSNGDASWLRFLFDDYNLGKESYIHFESLTDGGWQTQSTIDIVRWCGRSAFFNGHSVRISLYVAKSDRDVFFSISEVLVGYTNFGIVPDSLYTYNQHDKSVFNDLNQIESSLLDSRTQSNYAAVSRNIVEPPNMVLGVNCTSWLISNGVHLTAGHCDQGNDQLVAIEYNVPLSTSNGTRVFAHPNHQYPVDRSSIIKNNSGYGNDWAVFRTFPNSNTGLTAIEAQDDYYRLTLDIEPSSNLLYRSIGYGLDNVEEGPGPSILFQGVYNHYRNEFSGVQQTATGSYNSNCSQPHCFKIDVHISYGNSGGPVIDEDSGLALGIQTHGENRPSKPSGYLSDFILLFNTSIYQKFSNVALSHAIETAPGNSVVYADVNYPTAYLSYRDGTFFRPYDNIQDAADIIPQNGILSLVEGVYSGGVTLDKAMTISVPVGTAVMGGGVSKLAGDYYTIRDNIAAEYQSDSNDIGWIQNYPNPFNNSTMIEFFLVEDSKFQLEIFDVTGRRIITLLDQSKPSGKYSIRFNPSNMATGLYLIRLRSGKLNIVKPMLYIK